MTAKIFTIYRLLVYWVSDMKWILLVNFFFSVFPLILSAENGLRNVYDARGSNFISGVTATHCGTAVTTDQSFQCYPQIWEDKIIWLDSRLGNQDIFLYDTSKGVEKPLTETPFPEGFPDIYKDRVVYQVWGRGGYNVWLLELSTGKSQPISEGEDWHEMLPKIWGDLIVWEDWRRSYGEGNIFLYNLKDGKAQSISPQPAAQGHPDIFEDKVVWHDKRNGNWDIYLYDISTGQERLLTEDPADQFSPAIHDNKVVWVDARNGNWDIYLYDLTTNTTRCLCKEESKQYWPQIWGDKILWVDERAGESYVYVYDLKTNQERPLCTSSPAPQKQPALYGNRIVWMDLRNGEPTTPGMGNWDIYTTTSLPLFRITASLK